MKKYINKKTLSLFTAAVLGGSIPTAVPVNVCAANSSFITEIRLAGGADATETLEEAGYSVYPTSLNYTDSEVDRVYLGYKKGKGDPVTNIIVSEDKGESFTASDGFLYSRAGDADVDAGTEASNGLMYYTTDPKAGEPLVGVDVLMADASKEEVLYAIPNDGAEVIRRDDGSPADLEKANDDITMYMAQIRDGLVKPYVSEIAVVSGTDKYDAVYSAASHGYNYYIEGDIEAGDEGYTILACEMTQDKKKALTDVIAVSAETVSYLEEKQITTDTEKKKDTSGPDKDASGADSDISAADEKTEDTDTSSAEPKKVKAKEQNARPAALAAAAAAAEDGVMEEETVGTADDAEVPVEEEGDIAAEDGVSDEAADPEDAAPADGNPAEDGAVTESAELTDSITDSLTDSLIDSSVSDDGIKLTGEAIEISGVEYTRVSSRQISGPKPCYLYATRDKKAGNPIAMLSGSELEESTEIIFGTWAYSRIGDKGNSNAYIYAANEDELEELRDDKSVYVWYPVYMLDVKDGDLSEMRKSDLEKMPIALLAAKEGISRDRLIINGLKEPVYDPPKMERDTKAAAGTGLQSSVFGDMGGWILGIGSVILLAGIASAVVMLKKKQRTDI